MSRSPFRRAVPAAILTLLASSVATPADVRAGGDAPDPCQSRLHFGGERTTFEGTSGPTELLLSVTAGPDPVDLRFGRIFWVDGETLRPVRARGVTDDAGHRQPRRILFAAGETKRLHLAIQMTDARESYRFAIDASSGRCRYTAEVRARASRPPTTP